MRFQRGIYPLSADPIHNGHLDIIRRAATLCDTLIVAILENMDKDPLLSAGMRASLTWNALNLPNVKVITSDLILVDLFQEQGCDVLFRGVRDGADMVYEAKQMGYHDRVLPGFSKHVQYIPAGDGLQGVSSSLLKAFVSKHIDVSSMTTLAAKSALERRIHNMIFVGVAGPIAVGKSRVCRDLIALDQRIHHIAVDDLVKTLYTENSPGAQNLRTQVASVAGPQVLTSEGHIDPDALKAGIASGAISDAQLAEISTLTHPHVSRHFRKAVRNVAQQASFLRTRPQIVLVEWSNLVENDAMLRLVNNQVLLVTASDKDRNSFCARRGIGEEIRRKFDATHGDFAEKQRLLARATQAYGFGWHICHTNAEGQTCENLRGQILKMVHL